MAERSGDVDQGGANDSGAPTHVTSGQGRLTDSGRTRRAAGVADLCGDGQRHASRPVGLGSRRPGILADPGRRSNRSTIQPGSTSSSSTSSGRLPIAYRRSPLTTASTPPKPKLQPSECVQPERLPVPGVEVSAPIAEAVAATEMSGAEAGRTESPGATVRVAGRGSAAARPTC